MDIVVPKRRKFLKKTGYKEGNDATLCPPNLLPKWVPIGSKLIPKANLNHAEMNNPPGSIVDHEMNARVQTNGNSSRNKDTALEDRLLKSSISNNVSYCFLEL